jgi:hypothetical protein
VARNFSEFFSIFLHGVRKTLFVVDEKISYVMGARDFDPRVFKKGSESEFYDFLRLSDNIGPTLLLE